MKRSIFALTVAATIGVTDLVSAPAEAHWRGGGWGPGIAGGLIGAAVIGGIASSAYGYGPGYDYYGGYAPGYYDGYAPAYYGGYATSYAPATTALDIGASFVRPMRTTERRDITGGTTAIGECCFAITELGAALLICGAASLR